jgi:hypothetical protein
MRGQLGHATRLPVHRLILSHLLMLGPGCGSTDPISSALAGVADSQVVDLAAATDPEWERLHIFGPYMPAETVRVYLGSHPAAAQYNSADDARVLVAFMAGAQVLRAYELTRRRVDLAPLSQSRAYTRDEARFRVVHEGHRIVLQPLCWKGWNAPGRSLTSACS